MAVCRPEGPLCCHPPVADWADEERLRRLPPKRLATLLTMKRTITTPPRKRAIKKNSRKLKKLSID